MRVRPQVGQEMRLGPSWRRPTACRMRLAVTGYGKADKKQVMQMTQRLLHLAKLPRPDDAADALAIAFCHSRTATSLIDTDRVFDAKKYDTR